MHAQAQRQTVDAPALRFERGVLPLREGLRAAALRLTRDPDEADDLLQETLLRAWRFFARYEPNSNLRAWLHRILRNTFINRYRRVRREREVMAQVRVAAEVDAPAQPELPPLPEQQASLSEPLARELAALPPEFRAVVWAVAVDELSYRETAQTLGCPIGTVMSRLHRGRHALQRALDPEAQALGHRAA